MADLIVQDFAGIHNSDLEKTSARLIKGGKTAKQIKQAEKDRAWYARNAEYKKKRAKEYYAKHREEKIAYAIAYRAANYEKTIDSHLKCRYGLTQKQVYELISNQDGKCKICGVKFNRETKKTTPHIDHCHSTGRIRGVLCSKCNVSLGHLEKPGFLEAALKYLEVS